MHTVSTRLLLTCAAIGVAGGLANIGNAYLFNVMAVVAPVFLGAFTGLYFLPGIVAQAALRRGGVALLTELIAGLVAAPFSPTGFISVSVFVILGLLQELPFLLSRYRYWAPWVWYAGAAFAAAFFGAFWHLAYDMNSRPVWAQLTLPALLLLTLTAVVWMARRLAARVARTGVFRGLANDPPL
ncbi:ECF transporter S component [Verrucosispora sp. WMMD573]|uniref:ECF transporter S component n=1 Tax=Verrucosispora sp. WMMD573 TaxID=3015149 RepID=UPI00248BF63C|nr:ECF transporter S component [Verrucosispora sp. WMMD573]WBB53802.1 ECF transporter S component [Verrucosispora sp. WMMD573]